MDFEESLRLLESVHPESCPRCGSMDFIKYGKTKNKKQRFQCKNCLKTFSNYTNTPFMYSKKPLEMWIGYVTCMAKGLTLRSISNLLSINLTTSFFWRHKILSVVETLAEHPLTGTIEIDELILKESFKGARRLPKNKSLDIRSKYGNLIFNNLFFDQDKRDNIIILSCIDSENKTFIKAAAKMYSSRLQIKELDEILSHVIKGGKYIATSNNYGYVSFAKNNKLKLSMSSNYRIPGVNSDRAKKQSWKFRKFLKRFRNVASKYISHYINLFRLMLYENVNFAEEILNRLAHRKRKLRIFEFKSVQFDGEQAPLIV